MNIDELYKQFDEIISDKRAENCESINIITGSDTKETKLVKELEYKGFNLSIFESPKLICPNGYLVVYKPILTDDEPIKFDTFVPYFSSGIEERKSFYNTVGLKSYGDLAVLNRSYLGKIKIDNLKEIKRCLKTKFYQNKYKYIFGFYKKETISLYDCDDYTSPFAFYDKDNFIIKKYKCKVFIKKDKSGVEILYIKFPIFGKKPKNIYLKYECN